MPRVVSLTHRPGDAESGFLWAQAPGGRYEAIFEDDGEVGYLYGLDQQRKDEGNNPIVDALMIYRVEDDHDRDATYEIEIRWADERNRVGLFVGGECHAVFDFDEKRIVCRSGFPPPTHASFADTHEWDEALVEGLT